MSNEVEVKLSIDAEHVTKIPCVALLSEAEAKKPKRVISIYYDTPELDLKRIGVAYRVRLKGTQWLQTVKSKSNQMAGLSTRKEHEVPITGEQPELDNLGPFQELIDPYKDQLTPMFTTDFNRSTWIVTQSNDSVIEVVLDEGEIYNEQTRMPLLELELELMSGDEGALLSAARELASILPFYPETLSKAARGYRLSQTAPIPLKTMPSESVDLWQTLGLAENAVSVLRNGDAAEARIRLYDVLAILADRLEGEMGTRIKQKAAELSHLKPDALAKSQSLNLLLIDLLIHLRENHPI